MAAEIERKFLLERLPSGLAGRDRIEIEQGYLAISETGEVRLRRAGGECTLTVKRGHGVEREEREVSISPQQLDQLWPACGERRLAKRRHLVPLGSGLRAEVDVYAGALSGLAVAEVEFPSAAAARRFEPPRWFGREVSADRRFANQALAVSGIPEVVNPVDRSRRLALDREEPVGAGLTRIAIGRAEKALERLDLDRGDEGFADAVHGARKDLKKLRAALRLLRGELGRKRYRRASRRFRDAGRALSASRDAAVKVSTLEALISASTELPPSAFAWRRALERERDVPGGGEDLGGPVGLIEAGLAEVGEWRVEPEGWKAIDTALLRSYRRGRRAMRAAEEDPAEANLHEWRKRAKDLWYELRILAGAWPELLEPTAEEAHRLSELLGDHQDLAVLREDLAGRRFDPAVTAALEAAIGAREADLAGRAFELGHRLYAESPKRFRNRLRAYWKSWRG